MISDDRKILVLGGSSFVGRHLLRRVGAGRTIATYNRRPFPGGVRFDSLTMRVADVIADPDAMAAAVLLLGDTQPDSCVADSARSRAINVESLKHLIDDLTGLGIPPVFASTEFVFDGAKGNYVESDATRPILLYGAQKLEIEEYLAANGRDHCVLRLAKIYGTEPGDGTMFANWLPALAAARSLRCAMDQLFSAVHVDDVVGAILAAIECDLKGVFHVAGPVGMSRLEYLRLLIPEVERRGTVKATVVPCSIHDFGLPERRPLDVTMRIDKLSAAAEWNPLHPAEACRRLCAIAPGHVTSA